MIANTTFLSRMDYWLELATKNELLNFHSLPLYLSLAIQEPFTLVNNSFLRQTAPRGGVVGYKCYLGKKKRETR